MKTNFLVCLACLPAIYPGAALGQSTFLFKNYAAGSLEAPVFDGSGNRLSGTNYLTMLYGGPTVDSLQPARHGDFSMSLMIPTPFTYTPNVNPQEGYFNYFSAYVNIPSVLPGQFAWLQVRAWDARLGSSYEAVMGLGIGGYGESNLFQQRGGDPTVPTVPELLLGLQSFSLQPVVPEPSAALLLLLGLPWLFFRSRRKK